MNKKCVGLWNKQQLPGSVGESSCGCALFEVENHWRRQREGERILGHIIFRTASPRTCCHGLPFVYCSHFGRNFGRKWCNKTILTHQEAGLWLTPTISASKRCWYLPDSFGFSQVLIKELGLRHWLLFQLRDSSHNSSQFTSSFELPTSKAIPRSAWGLCSPPFVFDAFVARCWHLLEYLFWCTVHLLCDSLRPLSQQR